MTNIDRIHLISKSVLGGKDYLVSLIEQGLLHALLSDTEIERVQIGILTLLAKETELFNNGASSSIRIEKAQDLLASILYIMLSYGERMDDKSYTAILNDLLQCNSSNGKAEIICNKVSSFGDLLEILRDANLMQDELINVFQKIPSVAVAALNKRYPNDDFLYDESELKIYYALQTFKKLLADEVRLQLEASAKVIDFEM
jgi:hypothetical protein